MIETKFKQTEIGLIPEDWGCIKFGETIKFLSNNTLSRDFLCDDGAIKNIHYGDVLIKYGSVLDVRNSQITAVNEALTTVKLRNVAQDGDIIVADTAEDETVCKATELYNIGDCKVVSGLHTMWCRPQDGLFAGKYLGYFFNASIYHNQVLPYIQGIKVSSVSKSAIQDTFILVPNYSEQQRIASALTSIDNLLSSLDKLIAKKRDIKQGAMQQLLTGKTRLKGFTKPWIKRLLSEIAKTSSGGTPSRSIQSYYCGNIPWITTGELNDTYIYDSIEHITAEAIANSSAKICGNGTLLMAMYGATIGKLGILNVAAATNQACCAIKCISIDTMFLFYSLLFNRKSIIDMGCGAGQPNISQEIVKNLIIVMPSTIEEQQAIASVLSSIDDEIAALEAKRKKYEAVKQGMMQQLLTGKIRLINDKINVIDE